MEPSSPPGPCKARKAIATFWSRKSRLNVGPTSIVTASYPRRHSARCTAAPVRNETSRSDDCPPIRTPIRAWVSSGRSAIIRYASPTILSSRSSRTPDFRLMALRIFPISSITSAARACPRFTIKFPCFSETSASPTRNPFKPVDSMRRPAESSGGFLNTHPALGIMSGWVSFL